MIDFVRCRRRARMHKAILSFIPVVIFLMIIAIPRAAADNIGSIAVLVDSGACCVDAICAGNMIEEDCLALEGTWYTDQDCDTGFECPHCGYYVVGDWNGNGRFNLADIIAAWKWAMWPDYPGPALVCDCLGDGTFTFVAMDMNATCSLNIADIIWGYGKLKGQPNELMPCPECPPGPPPFLRDKR